MAIKQQRPAPSVDAPRTAPFHSTMKQGLLVVLWAWWTLGAYAGSPPVTSTKSGDHKHGGPIEAEAIHAAAVAWKTSCDRLVVKTRPAHRIPDAIRVDVTHKKGPNDRSNPKYRGILLNGDLHMGKDAVSTAILGVWGTLGPVPAADLAWLAEDGGHCSITEGPTQAGAEPECVGHAPMGAVHVDGRVGVRYWLRCRGGMRPSRSQSKWVAWVNPDQTIEKTHQGSCSDNDGSFRPPRY